MLEGDLTKESENGRLFRLLAYVNTVCDVPAQAVPGWDDSSERLIIRLFRDYLFHAVRAYVCVCVMCVRVAVANRHAA